MSMHSLLSMENYVAGRREHLTQLSLWGHMVTRKASWFLQGRFQPWTARHYTSTCGLPTVGGNSIQRASSHCIKCITRKECRVVFSTQQHVNKYAAHMYLHKCRIIGLLRRGKRRVLKHDGTSSISWGRLSVSLFALADWKSHVVFRCRKGKVFAYKNGNF